MSDIFTKEKRSEIMSKISVKETKPEILVRKFLFENGFRYRKNDKRYPGKPDILLPKYKTIIFINGCFWHGHNCPAGKLPETRKEFWEEKINGNIKRDRKNKTELEKQDWKIITIWQCELKNKTVREKTFNELLNTLHNNVYEALSKW